MQPQDEGREDKGINLCTLSTIGVAGMLFFTASGFEIGENKCSFPAISVSHIPLNGLKQYQVYFFAEYPSVRDLVKDMKKPNSGHIVTLY